MTPFICILGFYWLFSFILVGKSMSTILEDQLKVALQALEWYANENNWLEFDQVIDSPYKGAWWYETTLVKEDGGIKAKEALEYINGPKVKCGAV